MKYQAYQFEPNSGISEHLVRKLWTISPTDPFSLVVPPAILLHVTSGFASKATAREVLSRFGVVVAIAFMVLSFLVVLAVTASTFAVVPFALLVAFALPFACLRHASTSSRARVLRRQRPLVPDSSPRSSS